MSHLLNMNASPIGSGINPAALSIAFRDRSLCARTGTCVGICPEQAISLDSDYYPVLDETKCTSCGLCGEVCPGGSVSFSRLTELTFGEKDQGPGFDGQILDTHVGYSTDSEIRSSGAGGVSSQHYYTMSSIMET